MKTPLRALACVSLLGIVLCASVQSARATAVLHFTLDDLTDRATLIVHATITKSEAAWDAGHHKIWTTHTLTVKETLKGTHADTLTCRTRGGAVGRLAQQVSGEANLVTEAEYVLFLKPDDEKQYRVIGLNQGAFRVTREEGKDAQAKNSVAGVTIAKRDGTEEDAEKAQPISDTLEGLKTRIKKLVADAAAAAAKPAPVEVKPTAQDATQPAPVEVKPATEGK